MEKKKLLYALIFFSLFISMPAKAGSYHKEALQLSRDAEEKKNLYLKEAEKLKEQSTKHIQNVLIPKKTEQENIRCNPPKIEIKNSKVNNKEFFIFVSFSMPKTTLQSLYDEANAQNITLVLRGLKEGSFRKTGEYLKDLGIGVQIDPKLFKKYQIDKVPTFVWVNKDEYHTISGNISFQYAEQKFSEINQ